MEWWATGALDLVNVTIPGYDEKFLIDIKTMNPAQFKMPRPSEGLWNKYVAQCQLYLDWADLDTCIILGLEAGNPFKFKEIQIKRDHEYAEYIYHKWGDVSHGWATTRYRRILALTLPHALLMCGMATPKKRQPRKRVTRKTQHAQLLAKHRFVYDELLAYQKGGCAICGRPPALRRLDMDHDHKLMFVRGLLCHRCNRQLPSWMTPEWLRKAADYLESPPFPSMEQERL